MMSIVKKLRMNLGNWFFGKPMENIDAQNNLGWRYQDGSPQYYAMSWKPDEDYNQLHMLEEKLIHLFLAKYTGTDGHIESQTVYDNGTVRYDILFIIDHDVSWELAEGTGATKKEAMLKAIIQGANVFGANAKYNG